MVLYCSSSLYHILCFCIHKCLEHPEEDAVLIIPDNVFSKSGTEEFIQKIEASNIFSRVVLLRFTSSEMLNIYTLSENSEQSEIDAHIRYGVELVEGWLRKKDIDVKSFSEINTAIDHRLVGMYLLYHKIPYQYFEDGNGLLSRYEEQLEFHKKVQIENYHVIRTLGGLGTNQYVTKKYANIGAQLPGFHDVLIEDFTVSDKMRKLCEGDLQRIMTIFIEDSLHNSEDAPCALYLTRFVRYLQNPSIENHRFINATIFDFFCEDLDIIIKPHPRDFSGCYEMLFPDCLTLPKTFPSELLEFVFNRKFKKIITIGSTAIDAMTEITEEVIKLGTDFEERIPLLYEYYAAVIAMSYLYGKEGNFEIIPIAGSKELLRPLMNAHLSFASLGEEHDALGETIQHPIIGIAEQPVNSLWSQLYDGIFFLNQKDNPSFYQENILPSSEFAFLHVKVIPDKISCLSCQQETILPIYFQSDMEREALANIRFEKRLKYTRARIIIKGGLFE